MFNHFQGAVDVGMVLVGRVDAPGFGHVPHADRGVPGAAEEDLRQLAVPQQAAHVAAVAREPPELPLAPEGGRPVPDADATIVAAGADDARQDGVEGHVEDLERRSRSTSPL